GRALRARPAGGLRRAAGLRAHLVRAARVQVGSPGGHLRIPGLPGLLRPGRPGAGDRGADVDHRTPLRGRAAQGQVRPREVRARRIALTTGNRDPGTGQLAPRFRARLRPTEIDWPVSQEEATWISTTLPSRPSTAP